MENTTKTFKHRVTHTPEARNRRGIWNHFFDNFGVSLQS